MSSGPNSNKAKKKAKIQPGSFKVIMTYPINILVREAGFEPAMFLMWQILSLLRFTYFATLAKFLVPPPGLEPGTNGL